MSASARARSRTVSPVSSAAPYSVTTTPVWWRGVDTIAPAGSAGRMRERTAPPTVTVDVQADERVGVDVQIGARHEVLVAADTGDLLAVDVVGHDLPVEVDDRARR